MDEDREPRPDRHPRLLSRTLRPTAGHVDANTYSLGLAGTAGPFGDGFKRRVYSGVIRLNNPSGRREL